MEKVIVLLVFLDYFNYLKQGKDGSVSKICLSLHMLQEAAEGIIFIILQMCICE